jgi:hypothetical protein
LYVAEHARARIVEGETDEPTPGDIVTSIERILSKSREKRRHRKSHGRISFGDLARAIADQWKAINPQHKEIFEHYAEVDMVRYRREVKVWKDKKELESEANTMAKHGNFINSMSNSFNSTSSELEGLPDEGSAADQRAIHESFNSSYSSAGDSTSVGRRRIQSDSMMIQRQQQILRQQLHSGGSNFMTSQMNMNRQMAPINNTLPGSQAFHQSFSALPTGIADVEPSSSNFQMQPTMQQLQVQQQRQLDQMRQLQMQQLQIQQQIEKQRDQFQEVGAMNNNMSTMGHSSFSDVRISPFMSPQPTEIFLKSPSFNNNILDQSMHLTDALQGPSAHISDYSNSHASGSGFASSRSFGGMSFSDGSTLTGSFNNDIQLQQQHLQQQHKQLQQQQQAFMQQQQQQQLQQQNSGTSFSDHFSPRMAGQPNQQGGTGFQSLAGNADEKQQHDLTNLMDNMDD